VDIESKIEELRKRLDQNNRKSVVLVGISQNMVHEEEFLIGFLIF